MDINWSKAPEWANWLAQDACGDWFWFENKPELQSEGWDDDKTQKENKHEIAGVSGWKNSLQKRPTKPQAPEWDGKAAPAPGELAQTSSGKCEILGWDAQASKAAVQWHDGDLGIVSLDALKPLRTKKQRQRDELAGMIESYNSLSSGMLADAIIAEGWRKEE